MKFKNVFAAHPKAKEIYVVKGQPFVNKRYAENYAAEVKAEVETINRPSEEASQTVDDSKTDQTVDDSKTKESAKKAPAKKK